MNRLGELGMITEVITRAFFEDEHIYNVEWYTNTAPNYSQLGDGIAKQYVKRLQDYKYANKIIR